MLLTMNTNESPTEGQEGKRTSEHETELAYRSNHTETSI